MSGDRSKRSEPGALLLGLWIGVGVVVTLLTLALAALLVRYDRLSYGRHGAVVRRWVPRRAWALVALLPLVALVPVPGTVAARAGYVLVGSALAEIYSIGLHREARRAAFTPQDVPRDVHPLGGPARRVDDRRLHLLARTLTVHALTLVVVGLALGLQSPWPALVVACLFLAKFASHAVDDLEACVHWHMHCRVLDIAGRPHLTRAWTTVIDWLVGPLVGYVPQVYPANHLLVHHPESSGPGDIHSPLPYDRASFLEFGAFSLKMCGSLLLAIDLLRHRRCRRRHRRAVLAGLSIYWSSVAVALASGRLVGLWLVVTGVHRAVYAARGQIVWHGLIDPASPAGPEGTTILWVAGAESWARQVVAAGISSVGPRGNDRVGIDDPGDLTALGDLDVAEAAEARVPAIGTDWAFYDNHHLLHHLFPRAHYSRYPALLTQHAARLADDGAMVADLAGIESFAYRCWSRDLDGLATTLLTGPPGAARIDLLRQRLRPSEAHRCSVARLTTTPAARRLEPVLVRLLGTLIGARRGSTTGGGMERPVVRTGEVGDSGG